MSDSITDRNGRAVSAFLVQVAHAENARVTDVRDPFLSGRLYTVAFDIRDVETGEDLKKMSRVYEHDGRLEVYINDEMLLSVLGQTHRRSWWQTLVAPEGVSALIALMLTATIVSLLGVYGPDKRIPDVLVNALTVILGFYFGSATRRRDDR